jgi:hypothetical protein
MGDGREMDGRWMEAKMEDGALGGWRERRPLDASNRARVPASKTDLELWVVMGFLTLERLLPNGEEPSHLLPTNNTTTLNYQRTGCSCRFHASCSTPTARGTAREGRNLWTLLPFSRSIPRVAQPTSPVLPTCTALCFFILHPSLFSSNSANFPGCLSAWQPILSLVQWPRPRPGTVPIASRSVSE